MIGKLLKKDILRLSKHPEGFLALVSLPLLLTLLLSLVFGPGRNKQVMPKVNLLIVDHDKSLASQMIKGAFGRDQLADMFEIEETDEETAGTRIENNKASALLIIPENFSDNLLNSKATELTLVKNPSQQFGPKMAEETVNILAEATDRLLRIGAEPLDLLKSEIESENYPEDGAITAMAVSINQIMRQSSSLLFPPVIQLSEATTETSGESLSGGQFFTYILASIAVMFLFFIINALAGDIIDEKDNRTLYRIIVSPASVSTFVLSKNIYLFAAGCMSHFLMWAVAIVLFDVPLSFSNVLLFVLLSLLIVAAATGVISFLNSLIKSRMMVSGVLPAVIIVLGVLGGGMVPLQSLPPFIRSLSWVSPIFWGADGIHKVILWGGSFSDIAKHNFVLLGVSVVFGSLAILFHRRRLLS